MCGYSSLQGTPVFLHYNLIVYVQNSSGDIMLASTGDPPVDRGAFQEHPSIKRRKVNESNKTRPTDLPMCFHLDGEYANFILDKAGNCIKQSIAVKYYEGAGAEKEYNSHYYPFISRCSDKKHKCTKCGHVQKTTANNTSNIVHHHIKTDHPDSLALRP